MPGSKHNHLLLELAWFKWNRMQRESTTLDCLAVTYLTAQLREYFRVNTFKNVFASFSDSKLFINMFFASLFVIWNNLQWVKLKIRQLTAGFQKRNSVWFNLTQWSHGLPSSLSWIILWLRFLIWVWILHLNSNILVLLDAVIVVYAVLANISVQILLVRNFFAWKLKPRKHGVPFKI